jgi:hypothetical protein
MVYILLLLSTLGILSAQSINLDTQTKGQNFHWDNTNRRLNLGWNGSFGSVLGKKLDIKDAGPTWGSYSTLHNTLRVAINDYPLNAQFGLNTTGITEAIVGAIEIPSSSAAANHSAGIAGYVRTASTTQGAVGTFGAGFMGANGTSAWGGNFLVSNCGSQSCSPGYTTGVLYNLELDLNVMALDGGVAPNVAVRGIYLIGGSNIQSASIMNAIDIAPIGIARTGVPNVIPWKNAIYIGHTQGDYPAEKASADYGVFVEHGAVTTGTALYVGKQEGTGISGAQTITFHSEDSLTVNRESSITADPDGNMLISSPAGREVGITRIQAQDGLRVLTGTRPACASGNRGTIWYVAGGAGVVDTFEVCRKDAADAYAWVSLF